MREAERHRAGRVEPCDGVRTSSLRVAQVYLSARTKLSRRSASSSPRMVSELPSV